MKTLCPNCYSSVVLPVTTASLDFPQSLEPTLLSPSVLASVGATVCKQVAIPPSLGMVIGTLIGIGLANLNHKPLNCYSYYCRNCNKVFDVDNPKPHQADLDTTRPTSLVQSN